MSRALVAWMLVGTVAVAQEAKRPAVEVVFVLDTTGSMGGLIESAKRKIWSIATEIERGKPKPDLRVGLVAYRDKGDEYVTKVVGLTEDLDAIYGQLMQFQAGGGGDTPENVRQALHEALTKIEWSKSKEALRIVFLVGDAPPRTDYTDVPTVEELCASAAKAEVIVNAIRCGGDEETGRVWQQIAAKAEGTYMSIDQDGGVVAVATPYDKEMAELSMKLGATTIAYGDEKIRRDAETRERKAGAYAPAAAADRAAAKAEAGRYSAEDLVDALREKRVKLEELKDDALPEEMRKMTLDERRAHIEKKSKEREEVRAKIVDLAKKREAYIAEELKKLGARDSFDAAVRRALKDQGKRRGIEFESKD